MKRLELKVPPVLLMLLIGIGIQAVTFLISIKFVPEELSKGIAAVLLILGAIPVLSALSAFRHANTTVDPTHPGSATKIVTHGVFAYSRNPMYVSFALTLLAYIVFINNLLGLCGIVLFVWYMNRFQIEPEERFLTEKFGKEYTDYLLKVRRWI